MREPEALVLDIASAARRLAGYVEGITREQFLADDKTKTATVREINQLAGAHVPSDLPSVRLPHNRPFHATC